MCLKYNGTHTLNDLLNPFLLFIFHDLNLISQDINLVLELQAKENFHLLQIHFLFHQNLLHCHIYQLCWVLVRVKSKYNKQSNATINAVEVARKLGNIRKLLKRFANVQVFMFQPVHCSAQREAYFNFQDENENFFLSILNSAYQWLAVSDPKF